MNNKKDYCVRKAFDDLRKASLRMGLNERLQSIDQQAKQNRQKREEYEKTVKLLRLVDKYKEK